jgi:hypothetical protein
MAVQLKVDTPDLPGILDILGLGTPPINGDAAVQPPLAPPETAPSPDASASSSGSPTKLLRLQQALGAAAPDLAAAPGPSAPPADIAGTAGADAAAIKPTGFKQEHPTLSKILGLASEFAQNAGPGIGARTFGEGFSTAAAQPGIRASQAAGLEQTKAKTAQIKAQTDQIGAEKTVYEKTTDGSIVAITPDQSEKPTAAVVYKGDAANPKDPFQLWLKQNPGGKVEDFLKLQQANKTTTEKPEAEQIKKQIAAAFDANDTKTVKTLQAKLKAIDPEGAQRIAISMSNLDLANKKYEEPTSQTRSMAETAPKVLDLSGRIRALVKQQEDSLGPAASRWSEFMSGKIGAPNPEFTKLRTDVGLLQTALMRMHVGAKGGEQMMEHFRSLIDVAKQSPENLNAALDEIESYAQDVKAAGGPSVNPPSKAGNTPPKGAKIRDYTDLKK